MANPADESNTYSIRAVQRVCDLLDLLQEEPDGTSLTRAAEVTGLPKSSAFRYLTTLVERRYVERDDETATYHLGLALLPLQTRQFEVISQRARPYLDSLQEEFGETANLGLLDGNRVIYLVIVESARAMRFAARSGDRDPIHSTALGKAIAAGLPADRVRAILRAEGMPRFTEHTLVRQRDYLAQLDEVRDRGYAVDEGENEVGGRCVAVAIPDVTLPLAISLSAPAARLTAASLPKVAKRLRQIAERLAIDLTGGAAPE